MAFGLKKGGEFNATQLDIFLVFVHLIPGGWGFELSKDTIITQQTRVDTASLAKACPDVSGRNWRLFFCHAPV
ncbi:MAG: hypothetical protein MUD08_01095 [Cytophagales bacterium]|nr:hypothetical protein [Cytophagales bacterium]